MYTELDSRIIKCIKAGNQPLYNKIVNEEAERIAKLSGREGFRVIDGRLQALRKAKKIRFLTKNKDGRHGWSVIESSNAE